MLIAADTDGINGVCRTRGDQHHEAEREGRQPPDKTQ
jgi:hypothetical protein